MTDERDPAADVCDYANRVKQLVRHNTGKVLTEKVADKILRHLLTLRKIVKGDDVRAILNEPERIRRRVKARRRATDANARARARRLGCEVVEDVSIDEVRRRDNATCYLCNQWVDPGEQSLDHVVPLKRGGHHTYENIKLAHGVCNSRKGDRLLGELKPGDFNVG